MENRRAVFTPINASFYRRPPGVAIRYGAGGLVARCQGGRVWIALVREGSMSHYFLPKGGIERGETEEQAARREIEEEAGFTELELLADLGVHERLNYQRNRWQVIRYYLFRTSQSVASPTDREHDYRMEWFLISELPQMFWPDQRELIEKNAELIRISLRCEGHVANREDAVR